MSETNALGIRVVVNDTLPDGAVMVVGEHQVAAVVGGRVVVVPVILGGAK